MAALFAFLSSFSFIVSAFALTRLLEPVADAPSLFGPLPDLAWSDLQSIALVVAVGLVARFPAKDGRIAMYPRMLVLAQIAFGIAPAIVVRIANEGAYAGTAIDAVVLRGLLLAPLAFAFGQEARRVLFHAGVPKVARLPEWGAVVAGLGLGAAASLKFGWWGVDAWTIALVAPLVLLVRFVLPSLDRADMPEPEPYDGGVRCVPSLVGGLLLAYSVAATVGIEARFGEIDSFAPMQCALLGMAAFATAGLLGNVRRAGLVLGTMAFVALTLRAFSNSWDSNHNGYVKIACLFVPGACLGVGLALLARFYFGLPRARKVLTQIPPEERRTPAGAPVRAAVMCVGLAIGSWAGVPNAHGGDVIVKTMILGAVGAALLVFFDTRAGIGRRLLWLALGGGAFTAAALT